MKKNTTAKIVATIWLIWIISSIVWTWILVLFTSNQAASPTLTQEELNSILENYNTWTESKPDLSKILTPSPTLLQSWSLDNTSTNN